MPSEWTEAPLGHFIELKRGYDLPTYGREDGPYPVVSSSGVTGMHREAKVHGPGVVTGRYGTIGEVFYLEGDFWPLNTTLYVRDFKGNDPRFVSYFLRTIDFTQFTDKAAVPGVNRNHLHELSVRFPPAHEQRRIAEVLCSLDDKIELNRWMNETLEAIARAIFKSWFVDFHPVRAKMSGREPAGMDAETAALFPDSMERSTLGDVPAGWAVGSMRDLITLSRDSIHPGDSPDEVFDHYSIPAFDEGRRPAREQGSVIRSSKFVVRPDVVLVSKLNPRFPRVWLPYLVSDRRAVASTEFLVATSRAGYSRDYLYSLFCSEQFMERFSGLVTGTSGSHQRVKPSDFLEMLVVVPPPRTVGAFTVVSEPLFHRIAANIRESETLATIRDTLLPRLISGELRLPPVDSLNRSPQELVDGWNRDSSP